MKVTVALMCLIHLLMRGQAEEFHCATTLADVTCAEEGKAEDQKCSACSTLTDKAACEGKSCMWTEGCTDECPALSADRTACETKKCDWTEATCSDECNGKTTDCTAANGCDYACKATTSGCSVYDEDPACDDALGCEWTTACAATVTCGNLNEGVDPKCSETDGCSWDGTSICSDTCTSYKETNTKCSTVTGCTWTDGTSTCSDICSTYTTHAACTGATACEADKCSPKGDCTGDTADTCKATDGCSFVASTCANKVDPACPGDVDTCGDADGCMLQTGECSNTDTGTCADQKEEDKCCARGCTWAECKDGSNMLNVAMPTLMLSLMISVKFLL